MGIPPISERKAFGKCLGRGVKGIWKHVTGYSATEPPTPDEGNKGEGKSILATPPKCLEPREKPKRGWVY